MSILSFASGVRKPWLLISQETVTQHDIPEGIFLLELDAASMTCLEDLYQGFATVFKFPDYFGENANALKDCLTDLEWLPADGYLLLIKNSENLLSEESDDALESLLSILDSAGNEWTTPVIQGEAWDRDGVPFHTILALGKGDASGFQSKVKRLGFEIQNI